MAQFSASDPIVILSYARTPMGGMQGVLADASATDLGIDGVEVGLIGQHDLPGRGCPAPVQRGVHHRVVGGVHSHSSAPFFQA